ncbi:MAG: ATP-binding protein [Desulfobacterales bacterium]
MIRTPDTRAAEAADIVRRFMGGEHSLRLNEDGPNGPIAPLIRTINELLVRFSEISARQVEIRKETRFDHRIIDWAPIGIFRIDAEFRIAAVNDRACRNLGYSRDELLGMTLFDIDPSLSARKPKTRRIDLFGRGSRTTESFHRRKDGSIFPVEVTTRRYESGDDPAVLMYVTDITVKEKSRKDLEDLKIQLKQAQKMETLGRLAGGVAHDFNNMLGVIIGYADLLKTNIPPESPWIRDLLEIEKASVHCKETVHQLLAYARKQEISSKVIDLNRIIADFKTALSRLIGEDIEMVFAPGRGLWSIEIHPAEIKQILMNLAVNARDAISTGGRIVIGTRNRVIHPSDCIENGDLPPGEFVEITVTDNGIGMDAETLASIFEPFFTTKEKDKGTGLGLSTVYEIVKQNSGSIGVTSTPGGGTSFRILFPKSRTSRHAPETRKPANKPACSGNVMLVEDDEMVRRMTKSMLETLGYTVKIASTPMQALSILLEQNETLDILLTDMIMPGMSGVELAQQAKSIRPGLKAVFMSGYDQDSVGLPCADIGKSYFVQKPFGVLELAETLHDAFNEEPRARTTSHGQN